MRLLLVVCVVALAGCVQEKENLQPLIAVAGTYAMMERPTPPAPAPAPPGPGGCVAGCRCAGTGIEKTGDGLTDVPCRCPDSCACKKPKQTQPCPGGKCPPTQRIVR